MEISTLNHKQQAINCFGYGLTECEILTSWYNKPERSCVKNGKLCPFYKTERGNDRYIPPRNGRYWYLNDGEVKAKVFTCSDNDKERMFSGNMYKTKQDAEKALKE